MVRRWNVCVLVLALCGCGGHADAQQAVKPQAVVTQDGRMADATQVKASLVRLQVQLLEKERENGMLKAQIADLQLNALAAAIQTMDPAVRKALGLTATQEAKPEQKQDAKPKD